MNHGSQAEMETLVPSRQMALKADTLEQDNTVASAKSITVNGASQTHTLYPSGDIDFDIDFVSFLVTASGTPHTIETFGLTNGADTFIELLDSNEVPILGSNNDNVNGITYDQNCFICPPNDATTLSSKVQITPSASGTLFVRVSRSPSAPNSSGIYGSYDLRITSP